MKAQSGGETKKLEGWNAICFGFGTTMYRELGVPIGIIQGAQGGTCISLWTSLATHRSNPIWKAVLEDYEAGDHEELLTAIMHVQSTLDEIRGWKSDCKKAAESGAAATKPPRWSVPDWDSPRPGVLYDTLVAPLAPFAIRGVLWYQGESDAGQAEAYKIMLPSMIRGWRNAWHDEALPFVIAQIAYTNGKPHQGPPKKAPWPNCGMHSSRRPPHCPRA